MYNFRYNIKNKEISSYKTILSLHSHCILPSSYIVQFDKKHKFNWLHFCAVISLPHKSLLEHRMISQYNKDGTVFTRYIDDHCKRQYQSKLQVNHCNKALTWNIIIYIPVSNRREPWYSSRVWRSRTLTQLIIWKSMHFHLLTHPLKASLPHCKHWQLPPTPFPTTPDNNYRNGISDELTWLKTANTNHVYTEWTQYHSQRSHHTRKSDSSASTFLPLIDAPVQTIDTQHHCI